MDSKGLAITKSPEKELSKNEQLFNNRLQKLKKLKEEISSLSKQVEVWKDRYLAEVRPLEEKRATAEEKLLLIYWNYYQSDMATQSEQKLLINIMAQCYDDMGEFRELLSKENEEAIFSVIYGVTKEEAIQEDKEVLKEMISQFAADKKIDLDIDWDKFDPFDPTTFPEFKENENKRANGDKPGPKNSASAAFKKAEMQRKLKENLVQKSLRSIYVRLAKLLHPDKLEGDTKKEEKEAYMKEAVAAYEKKDLLSLLQLELLFIENDTLSIDRLSKEVVTQYNKILLDQIKTLEYEIEGIKTVDFSGYIYRTYVSSLSNAEGVLKSNMKRMKAHIDSANQLYSQIKNDPKQLKLELKSVKAARIFS